MINANTKICMVIGDPVEHSLSPLLHNSGYKELGIEDRFVYLGAGIKIEYLSDFLNAMRLLNIRGVSATMPHKLEVLTFLDEVDPVAKKIGAANTIVNEGGVLKGYNTDWFGAVVPLKEKTALSGKQIAVLGAGGAARAVVYGLVKEGARVTVFNRTVEKAREISDRFGADFKSWEEINMVSEFDVIINATSLGMVPGINESPLNKELINNKQIILDLIYHPLETRLLKEAIEQGAITIPGTEMLLAQAAGQFELFTGEKAPLVEMRKALEQELKSRNEN